MNKNYKYRDKIDILKVYGPKTRQNQKYFNLLYVHIIDNLVEFDVNVHMVEL